MIVKDVGQHAIMTTWRLNEKEGHDGMKVQVKARLRLRGFQEEDKPRSDSPTVPKEMTKLVVSIAANEEWEHLQCSDVTVAFLQGKDIEREVFVIPPKEAMEDEKVSIWTL